jgi:hypothetical protein
MGSGKYSWFKIGVSNHPEVRLKELSTPCLPFELFLLRAVPVHSKSDACFVEKRLHKLYEDKRTSGEWFTDIDLQDFDEKVKEVLQR